MLSVHFPGWCIFCVRPEGKCEQMGCGPASVRYLTAEDFFIFARDQGFFTKVFLQSQCVKEDVRQILNMELFYV